MEIMIFRVFTQKPFLFSYSNSKTRLDGSRDLFKYSFDYSYLRTRRVTTGRNDLLIGGSGVCSKTYTFDSKRWHAEMGVYKVYNTFTGRMDDDNVTKITGSSPSRKGENDTFVSGFSDSKIVI